MEMEYCSSDRAIGLVLICGFDGICGELTGAAGIYKSGETAYRFPLTAYYIWCVGKAGLTLEERGKRLKYVDFNLMMYQKKTGLGLLIL